MENKMKADYLGLKIEVGSDSGGKNCIIWKESQSEIAGRLIKGS